MKIDHDEIISELDLKPFGAKGWLANKNLCCPECGKKGKFGIKLTGDGGAVNCFKCEHSESIFKYLRSIGKGDLIRNGQEYSEKLKLKKPEFVKDELIEDLKEIELPKGFERINYDKYLSSRNFKSHQYDQFEVGCTEHFLEKKLHNYVIFVIKQKGIRVAWLARSKYTKEWHEENLRKHKEEGGSLVLRYKNSPNTDFDRILGGFDEITDKTHTVIAVEGLLDKTNISNLLETEKDDSIKVVFTFGNKFSENQIKLLKGTNVENVILMYDFNTIKQSKRYSVELSRWFNVDVCKINDENIDTGNMNKQYLLNLLETKQNFLYFYRSQFNFNI